MRKIKFFAFIGMLTIAYLIGCIMGFGLCASIQPANANINSIQNVQSTINTQTIWVDGQRYVVFTSGSSSMAVIKK